MSGQQDNLRVLTDHIDELAAKQASAAGRLKIGGETVNDLASSVWATHGVVCAASNMAIDAIEAIAPRTRSFGACLMTFPSG